MKLILNCTIFILLAGALVHRSCKKEFLCQNRRETNKPPDAHAGKDSVIIFPLDSIILDGSASIDPDGTITGYRWTKISGPSLFVIVNASSSKTVAKNLLAGAYRFELKVTDDGGLSAKDTVQILVNVTNTDSGTSLLKCNASMLAIDRLPTPGAVIFSFAAGTKL